MTVGAARKRRAKYEFYRMSYPTSNSQPAIHPSIHSSTNPNSQQRARISQVPFTENLHTVLLGSSQHLHRNSLSPLLYAFKPSAAFLAFAPLNFTGRSFPFGFCALRIALARATASRLKSGLYPLRAVLLTTERYVLRVEVVGPKVTICSDEAGLLSLLFFFVRRVTPRFSGPGWRPIACGAM